MVTFGMSETFSFLDVQASISGPGGVFSLTSDGVSDDSLRIESTKPYECVTEARIVRIDYPDPYGDNQFHVSVACANGASFTVCGAPARELAAIPKPFAMVFTVTLRGAAAPAHWRE